MAADSQPFERGRSGPSPRPSGLGAFRRFMLASMASVTYPGTKAEQLLLAPQELRTADPSFATELYNGHLGLAGRLAEVEAVSPFDITPPSEAWARELYGFGWLRHLRATNSELSREQAKALVQDFIALKRSHHGLAWQPEIVGRRVISWLSNSVLVLDTGDPEGYEAFLKSLTSHLRYLSASYRDAPDGVPRLVALMALIYAGLCIAEQQAVVDRYSRPFGKELEPADPCRWRTYLAQPGCAGRTSARPAAAQAVFRRARPPAAERTDRRDRPHHADAALLPHRRRHARPLQRRGAHGDRRARDRDGL